MEQHPVPQNVTTFQFRLVGDMTLKQFGYLAAGVIFAYISTKLPLPFFFTWPMTLFFALGGFGLAFVPVEERPMDIWVASFLRNIYSPTQYVWQKVAKNTGAPLQSKALPQKALGTQTTLSQLHGPGPKQASLKGNPLAALGSLFTFDVWPKNHAASGHGTVLSRLYQPQGNTAGQVTPLPTSSSPPVPITRPQRPDLVGWITSLFKHTPSFVQPHVTFSNVFTSLTLPPIVKQSLPVSPVSPKSMTEAPKPPQQKSVSPQPHGSLSHVTAATHNQQQQLAQELARIKPNTKVPTAPIEIQKTPSPTQSTVRTIDAQTAVQAGLPKLTTFPNIITGIVFDDRGNLLPGALITVRDANDVPLRALKTNKLGQFAASTPLPNNTYLIEVEDPQKRYVFDRAQIVVAGTVIPALEIIAKSQKQIEREKLEKAIFGKTP